MKVNEKDYYDGVANWSFDYIDYVSESYTNWIYEDEVKKRIGKNSKVLDLGTAAGEKVLKYYPDCKEILGTDYSLEMIASAKQNLIKSGRKNISFRVMDNLKMDTPDDYFDLVTARHTPTDPKQIYKTLKKGGELVLRGVDKLDCWALRRMFNGDKIYDGAKPISLIDYEGIIDAGFKDVMLIPLHVIEYYKTKEELYKLLVKVPILDEFTDEDSDEYKAEIIDNDIFNKYVNENKAEKGIRLVRRYYGITARK